VDDLVGAILCLVEIGASGIVHVAGQPAASRHEVALAVANVLRGRGESVAEPVAVRSAELEGRPARRPAFSALDTTRYEALTGLAVGSWRAALGDFIDSQAGEHTIEKGR